MKFNAGKLTPTDFFPGTVIVGFIFFILGRYYPMDDFYRHMVAYLYQYNPSLNYPHSQVTHYSQYPGYEHLLALLHQFIGAPATVLLLEGVSFSLTYYLFYKLLQNPNFGQSKLVASQAALLIISALTSRILALRPEHFVFLMVISFFISNDILKNKAWFLTPIMICFYWLTPLWSFLILVHPDKLKRKLIALSLIFVLHLIFWEWYTKGDWVSSIVRWNEFSKNRVLDITELNNFWTSSFLKPWFWIVVFFAYEGRNALKKENYISLFTYSFIGYVRLTGAFIISVLPALKEGIYKNYLLFTKNPWISHLICICIFISALPQNLDFVDYKFPKGATVLASGISAYTLNAGENAGNIKIVPSFEYGATPKEIQEQIKKLPKMELNCDVLRKYNVEYVVENVATGKPPHCLEFMDSKGPWRIWKTTAN